MRSLLLNLPVLHDFFHFLDDAIVVRQHLMAASSHLAKLNVDHLVALHRVRVVDTEAAVFEPTGYVDILVSRLPVDPMHSQVVLAPLEKASVEFATHLRQVLQRTVLRILHRVNGVQNASWAERLLVDHFMVELWHEFERNQLLGVAVIRSRGLNLRVLHDRRRKLVSFGLFFLMLPASKSQGFWLLFYGNLLRRDFRLQVGVGKHKLGEVVLVGSRSYIVELDVICAHLELD